MTTLTTPAVARSRADLDALLGARRAAGPVVFVPTMGALHEGHATLMRIARERAGAEGTVVVSIFVNPLQFGAGEDLDRYPRTFDADLELAGGEGVDVVFAPVVAEMYPDGVPYVVSTSSTSGAGSTGGPGSTGGMPYVVSTSSTDGAGSTGGASEAVTVQPGPLADVLEGASRPGHFRGVLTVVAKLFGLVRPDVAVFGEKDYQQLALIRRMVSDLCLGIDVVGGETDREPDGLARSSRNRYLDAEQRQQAVALSRALHAAQSRASYGVPAARWAAMAVLQEEPGVELDYLALTTTRLGELPDYPEAGTEGRILVAARVGTTRLIDNLPLQF